MPFLRKYNTLTVTGTTAIRIPIIKRGVVDFAVSADWTPAAGDVKIAIDGAAAASVTNLPTAVTMGNTAYWEFILTAAELTCKSCVVTVADSATKAVEDQSFIVETFGHASAMYQADLSAANLPANVTQLLGTAWLTPGTAGTPDVNAKQFGGAPVTATTSVTIPAASTLATTTGAVGSVTGAVGSVSGAVGSVTGAVGSVTGNVGGNLNGNVVGSVASVAGNVSGSVGSVTGAVGSVTGSVGSVVGNVGGSTASVTGAVGSVTGNVGGDVAGKVLGGGSGTISGDGVRAASVTGAVGSVTGSVGSVVGAVELDSAVGTQIDNIENASGYLLAVLAGACADPQTASETYAITVFGSTFTVDMAGQTSTGTRTAPTLTKA